MLVILKSGKRGRRRLVATEEEEKNDPCNSMGLLPCVDPRGVHFSLILGLVSYSIPSIGIISNCNSLREINRVNLIKTWKWDFNSMVNLIFPFIDQFNGSYQFDWPYISCSTDRYRDNRINGPDHLRVGPLWVKFHKVTAREVPGPHGRKGSFSRLKRRRTYPKWIRCE